MDASAAPSFLRPFLPHHYPTGTERILSQYGDFSILRIYIARRPLKIIPSAIFMRLVNYVTNSSDLGPVAWHVFAILLLQSPPNSRTGSHDYVFVRLDKNEGIDIRISEGDENSSDIQCAGEPVYPMTLNGLLGRLKNLMGTENFYTYDAFDNNCQDFTLNILECAGLLSQSAIDFSKQDFSDFTGKWYIKPLTIGARLATDLSTLHKHVIRRKLGLASKYQKRNKKSKKSSYNKK